MILASVMALSTTPTSYLQPGTPIFNQYSLSPSECPMNNSIWNSRSFLSNWFDLHGPHFVNGSSKLAVVQPKNVNHAWHLTFSHIPHLTYSEILLALSSKHWYIPNPDTSPQSLSAPWFRLLASPTCISAIIFWPFFLLPPVLSMFYSQYKQPEYC